MVANGVSTNDANGREFILNLQTIKTFAFIRDIR